MAKKKRSKPHEEEAGEAWLLPYSDLMTLLLALFLCLFAMSQTDQQKMEAMAQAFTAAFNTGGPSFFDKLGMSASSHEPIMSSEDMGSAAYIQENQQLESVKRTLDEYIQQNNLQDELSTVLSDEGLMIRIKEHALFDSGSATPVKDFDKIGPIVAGLLASVPENVVISGHTDNVPISTAQFPSNWELSSSRALNIMKGLLNINANLDPRRFSAIGYSEYRPIADNSTDEGRSSNRRVEILISRSAQMPAEGGSTTNSGIAGQVTSLSGSSAAQVSSIASTGSTSTVGGTNDAAAKTTLDTSTLPTVNFRPPVGAPAP